jgi:hypothetical protein
MIVPTAHSLVVGHHRNVTTLQKVNQADCHLNIGSIYERRSAWRPLWSVAASARFGLIQTKSTKSPTPILVKPSASWFPMASSSANPSQCTHVPVLANSLLLGELDVTVDSVRGRVPKMLVCQGMPATCSTEDNPSMQYLYVGKEGS